MGEDDARVLLSQATSIYQSGESRQALRLLDEAISKGSADETLRAGLILQKAGWLRESGHTDDAAKTLDAAAKEVDRLPRSGHEMEGAAKIFREIGRSQAEGGDKSSVACSVANEGVTAAAAGDLDGAVTLFTRSHELHLAAGNMLHTVQDLLNLSGVEMQRGHDDKALSYAEQALVVAAALGDVQAGRGSAAYPRLPRWTTRVRRSGPHAEPNPARRA